MSKRTPHLEETVFASAIWTYHDLPSCTDTAPTLSWKLKRARSALFKCTGLETFGTPKALPCDFTWFYRDLCDHYLTNYHKDSIVLKWHCVYFEAKWRCLNANIFEPRCSTRALAHERKYHQEYSNRPSCGWTSSKKTFGAMVWPWIFRLCTATGGFMTDLEHSLALFLSLHLARHLFLNITISTNIIFVIVIVIISWSLSSFLSFASSRIALLPFQIKTSLGIHSSDRQCVQLSGWRRTIPKTSCVWWTPQALLYISGCQKHQRWGVLALLGVSWRCLVFN